MLLVNGDAVWHIVASIEGEQSSTIVPDVLELMAFQRMPEALLASLASAWILCLNGHRLWKEGRSLNLSRIKKNTQDVVKRFAHSHKQVLLTMHHELEPALVKDAELAAMRELGAVFTLYVQR